MRDTHEKYKVFTSVIDQENSDKDNVKYKLIEHDDPTATTTTAGLYVVDVLLLMNTATFERFLLSRAITGANELMDVSRESQRISFFANLFSIRMISFPHNNTVSFMGIRPKKNFLIWRSKNGFFSALDIYGELFTWSMITGDILYSEKITKLHPNDAP